MSLCTNFAGAVFWGILVMFSLKMGASNILGRGYRGDMYNIYIYVTYNIYNLDPISLGRLETSQFSMLFWGSKGTFYSVDSLRHILGVPEVNLTE